MRARRQRSAAGLLAATCYSTKMSFSHFEIRAAKAGDAPALYEVARHLNSVNLPANLQRLERALAQSEASFSGKIGNVKECEYIFVLVDHGEAHNTPRIIGCSMIFAQLGRRGAPYIYLDVLPEERYSSTIDRHVRHTTLKIGYSYDGPTELGGLALLPEYRKTPEQLGLCLSAARFLYIRAHRAAFQDELLAELMPPLKSDGSSALWDALGSAFTSMSYEEADKLSRENKEFIRGLFPELPIHASLLSKEAQAAIGQVGPAATGARDLLTRIGFRYADRIDPFDGGPHYTAPTDAVSYVRETRRVRVHAHEGLGRAETLMVASVTVEAPHFQMIRAQGIVRDGTVAYIPHAAMNALALEDGDDAWVLATSEIPISAP